MNETFVNAINSLIQRTLNGVDNTINFLSAQIPDVLRQLITFNIVKESIFVLVLSIPIIIYIATLVYIKKQKKNNNKNSMWNDKFAINSTFKYSEGALAFAIVGGGFIILNSGIMLNHIINLAELIFAPKVWLLEYASDLIKSVKQ